MDHHDIHHITSARRPRRAGRGPSRLLALGVAMTTTLLLALPGAAQAGYPAVYWKSRTLRVPFGNCQPLRANAMKRAGFSGVEADGNEARGTSAQSRGFVTCVRLPRAGACQRDGATIMMVVAGNDANEARALLGRIDQNVGDPVLFDCN